MGAQTNPFFGKKVLITGHTGFKGSWLSLWLDMLGANVVGVGLTPLSTPSNFEACKLNNSMKSIFMDIRNSDDLELLVQAEQPDIVFHLAAQAIVKEAFNNPLDTFATNILGTANVLNGLRRLNKNCAVVIITSDKCYENVEWLWSYRENDRLGGIDPYSASKASAELIASCMIKSYFPASGPIKIGIARAGNVIGGGDWSANRIVPDIIRAKNSGTPLKLRNPQSTRPWQHVLEPLGGYLTLAMKLQSGGGPIHGQAFNFGPSELAGRSVMDLVSELQLYMPNLNVQIEGEASVGVHEAGLLKLNCEKALSILDWKSVLDFSSTAKWTAKWYENFDLSPNDVRSFSESQICAYQKKVFDF